MSSHTPGPWYADATAGGTALGIWSAKTGALVGETHRGQHENGDMVTDDEAEANARLITVAPDLLALVVKLEWSAVREGPGDGPMFSGRGKPYPACAICGGIKPMADGAFSESALGHRDGCELATLIAKAKGGA